MQRPKYPTDLTNKQWKRIKELWPPAKPGGRRPMTNLREVLNALLYVTKTGIQWRLLPHDFPPHNTVYGYFWQWRNDGVWQRIHDTLRAQVRQQTGRHNHPTAGCFDSQSVKTTQVPGVRGFDAGKLVNGRKRHILVDTTGLLLVVLVTAASVQDRDGARRVLKQLPGGRKKLRKIWVDGGSRGELIDWAWQECKLLLTPVLRPHERKGFVLFTPLGGRAHLCLVKPMSAFEQRLRTPNFNQRSLRLPGNDTVNAIAARTCITLQTASKPHLV